MAKQPNRKRETAGYAVQFGPKRALLGLCSDGHVMFPVTPGSNAAMLFPSYGAARKAVGRDMGTTRMEACHYTIVRLEREVPDG